MKKYKIMIGLFGLLLLAACGPRQIPERKMQAIIRDIFLVNAYMAGYGTQKTIRTDSVDIYTPILEDYGYDLADFRHTLDRWTLKKSSKLSELIDGATADIRRENEHYVALQQAQDRLDTLIRARYRDTLYRHPDSIRVGSSRNLDRLRFTLAADPGTYRIRYRYLVDSAVRSSYISFRYELLDSASQILRTDSRGLTERKVARWIDLSFDAAEGIDSLRVTLADYRDKTQPVAFRADSIQVIYNEPIEAERKRYLSDVASTALGIKYPYEPSFPPKDSGALHVVSPLRPDTARHTDL